MITLNCTGCGKPVETNDKVVATVCTDCINQRPVCLCQAKGQPVTEEYGVMHLPDCQWVNAEFPGFADLRWCDDCDMLVSKDHFVDGHRCTNPAALKENR